MRYARRWRIAGGILLAVVMASAMAPPLWTGREPGVGGLDKWLHGLTFCVLALWFGGQYARNAYWWIACALALYGALIEAGQSMVSYRTAEWGDLVADCLGILLGLVIALRGAGGWSVRAENWLENRIG